MTCKVVLNRTDPFPITNRKLLLMSFWSLLALSLLCGLAGGGYSVSRLVSSCLVFFEVRSMQVAMQQGSAMVSFAKTQSNKHYSNCK